MIRYIYVLAPSSHISLLYISWHCLYILYPFHTYIYEKRRGIMIEYSIKIYLNKERK